MVLSALAEFLSVDKLSSAFDVLIKESVAALVLFGLVTLATLVRLSLSN